MDKNLLFFLVNRILKVLVLALLCAGCNPLIPVMLPVYYPEADSGEVIYSRQPLAAHAPTAIRFSQHGIHISIRFNKHKGKKYFEMVFNVPEGKTVKLLGTSVTANWDENSQPVKGEIKKIFLREPISRIGNPQPEDVMDINDPMIGGKRRDTIFDSNFWLATYLDVPPVKDIRISLPQFTVNEELVILPEIRYHKKLTPAGLFLIS